MLFEKPKTHDFYERLAFSEGIEITGPLMERIANMVPNAIGIERADENADRNGTDYWILRSHRLPTLSVDVKHRGFCPIERFGSDDACIETTSVYIGQSPWKDSGRRKVGWTLDYSKRTDFVVYTWPNGEGTRYWILPFVPLCRAARDNWRVWAAQYGERPAKNNGYLTLSVYPPRSTIAKAMKAVMAGVT